MPIQLVAALGRYAGTRRRTCRDARDSIAFGASLHDCARAFASRAMVADTVPPSLFTRLKGLRRDEREPVPIGGGVFRRSLNPPVKWDAA